jgi:DNA-binding MarR family transcriptional regulator
MHQDATQSAEMALAVGLGRAVSLVRSLDVPREASLTSISTLATLERFGGCKLTELSLYEGVTQPAMTQLVSRLEEGGLAERRRDPDDGRVVRVFITDAGHAALNRRRTAQAERLAALLAELPDEDRAALAAALPALDRLASQALTPGRDHG